MSDAAENMKSLPEVAQAEVVEAPHGGATPAYSRTAQPSTLAKGFVHEHPVLAIAGGVAAGVIIAALIPARTRKALVKRTSALSEVLGTAAVSLGHDAADRASAAGKQLRKSGHVLADNAEDWTAVALRGASAFAQSTAENLTKLSETAADQAERFGDVAADRLGKAGRKTSSTIDKAVPIAEAAAAHAGKRLGNAIADLRARLKS